MDESLAPSASTIQCASCGKRYRWKKQFAGHQVRCTCSILMVMPETPPEPGQVDAANGKAVLERGGLLAKALGRPPSAMERALEQRVDEVPPSRFLDRDLPVALIMGGLVATSAGWFYLSTAYELSLWKAMLLAVATLLLHVFVYIPAAVGSIFFVARVMDIAFGELQRALLKLTGIMIGPSAIADIFFVALLIYSDFDERVVVIAFCLYMVFYGLPLKVLFALDLYEMVALVLLMSIPRSILVLVLALPIRNVLGILP